MKKRSFISNYFYNMFYQILALVVPLISTPYVSRVLGATAIGDYGFTSGIVTYFGIVAATGTVNYGKREIAFKQDDKTEHSRMFFEILLFRILCTCLVTVAYIIFICLSKSKYRLLYIIHFLTVISWALDVTWFFQGMEDFKVVTIRDTIVKLLSTILIFLLIKSPNDLWLYALILSASVVIGNLSAWPSLKYYICKVDIHSLNIERHIKGIMVMFASVVAVQIYTVLDQTMLGIISSTTEVGYYTQAQKVIKLALTVVGAMATVMLPRIAVLYSNDNRNEMNRYFHIAIDYLFILSLPMLFGCILCSNDFVPIFFGNGYKPVIRLLQFLSILFVVLGVGQLFGSLLTAIDKQLQCTVAVVVGAITNFTLNSLLIRKYDSMGAVIASVIAETCVTSIELYIVGKSFDIRYIPKAFVRYLIPTLIMSGAVLFVKRFVISRLVCLIMEIFVAIIVYFLTLFIMKDKLVFEFCDKLRKK